MDLSALYKLGYGMYAVGSHKGDKLNVQIANTVFQITSEPPTVAVSINKSNLITILEIGKHYNIVYLQKLIIIH